MHNISTIYRFNTPFLNIEQEKNNLLGVLKKIEKSIEFDGIKFKKSTKINGDYYEVSFDFQDNLGKMNFFYISDFKGEYYLPIFKFDIFLDDSFLISNNAKQRAVKFLNNIFECFDGLNEKEFLIDLNNNFYYRSGFFGRKVFPNHDFLVIKKIQKKFESRNGIKIMERFIYDLQNHNFILTKENSSHYLEFYGNLLYFIYLVFLMHQNMQKTENTLNNLNNLDDHSVYEGQVELMKKRLSYIDDLHMVTFSKYKQKLKIFFKLIG